MKIFDELAAFLACCIKQADSTEDLPPLYALLGYARWNLKDYQAAAAAWDAAFSLDKNNGLYAANAANAWDLLGKKNEAFKLRLAGGECFLRRQDYAELGAIVPQLLETGKKDPQAHELAGKWAAATGDTARAETEMAIADSLRSAVKKTPAAKPTAAKPPKAKKLAGKKTAFKEEEKEDEEAEG